MSAVDPTAAVAATSDGPATPAVADASPIVEAEAVAAVTAPSKVKSLPQDATPVFDPGDCSPIGWHDGEDNEIKDFVYEYGAPDPVTGLSSLHIREFTRPTRIVR